MPRHGLARINEHRVAGVAEDGSAVTFEFTSSPETLEAYPYEFKLNMTYAITGEATLTQTFSVTNTGAAAMPFSVGGHPAFNVPAPGAKDEAFEDYVIEFSEPWTCVAPTIAEGGLLTFDETTVLLRTRTSSPSPANCSLAMPSCSRTSRRHVDPARNQERSRRAHRLRGFQVHRYLVRVPGQLSFYRARALDRHATLTSEDDVFEHKRNVTVIARARPATSPSA
ncbi:MAG: aldose 1-epimerase family protein [Collinsella sp.]